MKHQYIKYLTLSFFLFSIVFTLKAQNSDEIWSKSSVSERSNAKKIVRKSMPKLFGIYNLNLGRIDKELDKTPKRKRNLGKSSIILSFPNESGKLEKFQVFEASIMEEELQRKHPNIRSFIGKGIDNPSSVVRFSLSSLGLHAMVSQNSKNTVYIDPYTTDKESYIVYTKNNLPDVSQFECLVEETETPSKLEQSDVSLKNNNAGDGILRTFRLAIATTGEYSQFQIYRTGIGVGATDEVKKNAVLSAINATMTRVNGIFERDVALTMVLVANNTDIIFLDATTDGLTNDDSNDLIDESQTIIDREIGNSNYDIGHTFSTGGGGLAQLNSPCTTRKAMGITGSANPTGDAYDIDYVAHEMGHQFGAHHTFNGDADNCSGGNRNNGTAVEPGSGSTIMGYAGICTPQNVQNSSDAYFHLVSVREMWNNISIGASNCGTKTSTGNNAPVIEDLSNYTVPISTPFLLNANATDVDGDNLTYTWEQLDIEITQHPLISTATGGPAFRSISPKSDSFRHFPNLNTTLAGNLSTTWEVLPSVGRSMRFGVSVRDNNVAGGQTASEELSITYDGASGPFSITSQMTSENWDKGTSQAITWDVANTNNLPVNCQFVNILFSTDGGNTFSINLASNVPNDGSHIVIAPGVETTKGRIKIESVENIFYTINSKDISIQSSEFILNFDSYSKKVCSPNATVYTFTYNTFLGFNEEITFSATNTPAGSTVLFNPVSATEDGTVVEMTIDNISDTNVGNYNISVTGTSTSETKTTSVVLDIFSSNINVPILNSPEDNTSQLFRPYVLNWNDDVNVLSYEVQISTDNLFTTIIEFSIVENNLFKPLLLALNTNYFWRVKSINDCGESSYSSIYNFTTANVICDIFASTDTPLNIPDNNTTGISSIISLSENKLITDVNVAVNITHPWIGDLTLTLISPSGTSVLLVASRNDEGDNYVGTVFDSDAEELIYSGIAPFTGTFQPLENLSSLKNEESLGSWTLKVVDGGGDDVGSIENWSIEVCGVSISSDSDNDGVQNNNDLCSETPEGEEVDDNGCSIDRIGQLDDDNDGVKNSNDLCLNTPAGATVDLTGCLILPLDNFTIKVVSETCPNKDNGQIKIETKESYDYVTTINGIVYNFTEDLTVEELEPAVYNFCITVTDEDYEQCYTVEVLEGDTVSGKLSIANNKATIEMERGTAPFKIFINDKEIYTTSASEFSVAVKHGDILEVKTAVACEGVYAKTINLLDGIVVYPNPTKGNLEISLPVSRKEVVIALYNSTGQLVSKRAYPVVYGKVQLDLTNSPSGLYIAKLALDKPVSLKIIKQ
ncbi:MAG: proprotein convertase P-domain-containing protein [Lutibacter sp.]|nr:proprotein convertase P-domain-containing protein [Lutibacter sp.]